MRDEAELLAWGIASDNTINDQQALHCTNANKMMKYTQ
jgi:hypothetical protein